MDDEGFAAVEEEVEEDIMEEVLWEGVVLDIVGAAPEEEGVEMTGVEAKEDEDGVCCALKLKSNSNLWK